MSRNGWAIVVVVLLCAAGFVQAQFDRLAPSEKFVYVGNFPVVQNVAGTVSVDNFPASHSITGTVNVGNLPVDASGNLMVAGGGITNQVLDLLDVPTELTYNAGYPTWESEIFDTAAFNRLCVTGGYDYAGAFLQCTLGWQSDDEEFIGDLSILTTLMPYQPRCEWYDPWYAMDTHQGQSVRGVRAKVICKANTSQGSLTLNDIKVLLRRE